MENALFELSKLHFLSFQEDNYHMWSRKIELALCTKGVWDVVNATDVLDSNSNEKEAKKYQNRKQIALSCVLFSVINSCVASVIDTKDFAFV